MDRLNAIGADYAALEGTCKTYLCYLPTAFVQRNKWAALSRAYRHGVLNGLAICYRVNHELYLEG